MLGFGPLGYAPLGDNGVSTGGVQTLTPALFTNTQTFYGPTVSSNYTIAPALFTNEQIFYQPTVVQAQTLAPALFTNVQVFYSPSVYPIPWYPSDTRLPTGDLTPGARGRMSLGTAPRGGFVPAYSTRGRMPLAATPRLPLPGLGEGARLPMQGDL